MRHSEQSIGKLIRQLNQEASSDLRNYLLSISQDHAFLETFISAAQVYYSSAYPVFANQRNGVWYRDQWHGLCYFKSTDGHYNNWNFSLTRLNLHLLCSAEKSGGMIIVDSTRRGKSFPDSLSKTIPIWCCILNRLKFRWKSQEEDYLWDCQSYFPPSIVSESEQDQIAQHMATILASFDGPMEKLLQSKLKNINRPLRPLWFCNHKNWEDDLDLNFDHQKYNLVMCVSVSEAESPPSRQSWHYIPGAADDEENWAPLGFTWNIFWKYHHELINSFTTCETAESYRKKIEQFIEIEKQQCQLKVSELNRTTAGTAVMDDIPWVPTSLGMQHLFLGIGGSLDSASFQIVLRNGSIKNAHTDTDDSIALSPESSLSVPITFHTKSRNKIQCWDESIFPSLLTFVCSKTLDREHRRGKEEIRDGDQIHFTFCILEGGSGTRKPIYESIAVVLMSCILLIPDLIHDDGIGIPSKGQIRHSVASIQSFYSMINPSRQLMKELTKFFCSAYNGQRTAFQQWANNTSSSIINYIHNHRHAQVEIPPL